MEQTFAIIKPDAVQRGLVGTILQRIEQKGFKIVAMKMLAVSKEQAEMQYACHQGKPFYSPLIDFITSAPVVAMILEGEHAIEIFRKFIGTTDPLRSEPGTIRGDFAIHMNHNLIHASDSSDSFLHESQIYFSKQEIQKYDLALSHWFYHSKP